MADDAAIDAAQSEAPKSLAAELRADRERLTEEREPHIFDLPGYGEKLAAKYRVLKHEEIKEIQSGIAKRATAGEENAVLIGFCSTLARACVGLYTKQNGEYVALQDAEELGADPIRWGDERLAQIFGLEGDNLRAREIIEAVIPDPVLIEAHSNRVTLWMERAREADDSDF